MLCDASQGEVILVSWCWPETQHSPELDGIGIDTDCQNKVKQVSDIEGHTKLNRDKSPTCA